MPAGGVKRPEPSLYGVLQLIDLCAGRRDRHEEMVVEVRRESSWLEVLACHGLQNAVHCPTVCKGHGTASEPSTGEPGSYRAALSGDPNEFVELW